ncbi:hypothetical protein BAY1663_02322 [Pseudomonas sp. BAY1663]|uniref:hypothetical protein n=1 Tax=Pseudomonas sp. BAY1663 TaxID=1439940 RepID=UPI00042DF9C4|nr:hypothetical protein [Pseudomonas sp. BAY1663]EXF45243.1 hypothetical protein BAY1663_02322 [Pseudomonas sp. BAY1663]
MSFDETKHNTIIELFKQGKTLREIGGMYAVSGERIRQILAAHGVTGKQGGQAVRTAKRSAATRQKREQACLEKHGCTLEQFQSVCTHRPKGSTSPYLIFGWQRNHANFRGIEWKMSFWEWFSVWQESGKWEERGRGAGSYCMCRVGDEGAYELGNVYIGSIVHNSTLGRTLAYERQKDRTPFHRAMISAGGRKVVSEALGVPSAYLSQLANDGYLPRCWLDDGRAESFAMLTCGAFTLEDLAGMCRAASEKEAA